MPTTNKMVHGEPPGCISPKLAHVRTHTHGHTQQHTYANVHTRAHIHMVICANIVTSKVHNTIEQAAIHTGTIQSGACKARPMYMTDARICTDNSSVPTRIRDPHPTHTTPAADRHTTHRQPTCDPPKQQKGKTLRVK